MKNILRKLSNVLWLMLLCCISITLIACGEKDDIIDSSNMCISLIDAYNEGYITRNDLMNISYYYSGSVIAVSDDTYMHGRGF